MVEMTLAHKGAAAFSLGLRMTSLHAMNQHASKLSEDHLWGCASVAEELARMKGAVAGSGAGAGCAVDAVADPDTHAALRAGLLTALHRRSAVDALSQAARRADVAQALFQQERGRTNALQAEVRPCAFSL